MYGLKNAPRAWYERFNDFMLSQNFVKTNSDHCMYHYIDESSKVYILVFVDDILSTGFGPMLNKVINNMKNVFKMKDLGLANFYLGINIQQDLQKGITTLDQTQYLKNVLPKQV